MNQQKEITHHHYLATEALESIQSALSTIEELNPAIGFQWDGLTDVKQQCRETMMRMQDIVDGYKREMN